MEVTKFAARAVVAMAVTVATYALCCAVLLGPRTSFYYSRFTTPRQGSLVLGTSRAAQGILPAAVTGALGDAAPTMPLYNFAFTMTQSPFGPSYLGAVRRKLAEPAGSALSILEVSPLAVSENRPGMGPDVTDTDGRGFLSRMRMLSVDPNIEFPLRYDRTGFDLAAAVQGWTMGGYRTRLHDDGWLEVLPPKRTAAGRAARVEEKLEAYRTSTKRSRLSEIRMAALRDTIRLLCARGPVFVVRLPTSPAMLQIEETYMPHFRELMRETAVATAATYVDMTLDAAEYATTDGNHLERRAAERASRRLGVLIREALRRSGSVPPSTG